MLAIIWSLTLPDTDYWVIQGSKPTANPESMPNRVEHMAQGRLCELPAATERSVLQRSECETSYSEQRERPTARHPKTVAPQARVASRI